MSETDREDEIIEGSGDVFADMGLPTPNIHGEPIIFDNIRPAPRSDQFTLAGQLDSALGLPERADTDFTLHADHQNYLFGRNRA